MLALILMIVTCALGIVSIVYPVHEHRKLHKLSASSGIADGGFPVQPNDVKPLRRSACIRTLICIGATFATAFATYLATPVSSPEIYPDDPTDSGDPTVSIDHDPGSTVYYSLDEITKKGEGVRYDENPINVAGVGYIQARAVFLGKWSEAVTMESAFFGSGSQLYGDDESTGVQASLGSQPDNSTDSSIVSAEYSPDYDHLPDGISSGWGDSAGGRQSVTINEVNNGVLGNSIVFNAISDSVIGDEKNFVGARENDGSSDGEANLWSGNLIEVETGKQYRIRLYGHNNNPNGYGGVANDVGISFLIPNSSGRTIVVNGTIDSSNAEPSRYWDSVALTCKQPFHLEYVQGSALLENNGMGAGGGYALPDSVVGGTCAVGYDSLDGQIPGCYQYAFYASVLVNVVAD